MKTTSKFLLSVNRLYEKHKRKFASIKESLITAIKKCFVYLIIFGIIVPSCSHFDGGRTIESLRRNLSLRPFINSICQTYSFTPGCTPIAYLVYQYDYLNKDKLKEKIAEHKASLSTAPEELSFLTDLGEAKRQYGNRVEALKTQQQVLRANSKFEPALIGEALALQDLNNFEAAENSISLAIKVNHERGITYFRQCQIVKSRANSEDEKGKRDKYNQNAEVAYQKAIELDPEFQKMKC